MKMIHHNYNRLITGYMHVRAIKGATHNIQNQHQLLEEADWPFPLSLVICSDKKNPPNPLHIQLLMFLLSKPDFYWQEFYPHNGKYLLFFLPLRTSYYYEGGKPIKGKTKNVGLVSVENVYLF